MLLTFLSKLSLTRGGKAIESNLTLQKQLHEDCTNIMAQKFNSSQERISADCDAISIFIFISSEEVSDRTKNNLRDFFYLFGTTLTLECGLPQNTTGSSTKDSIFSCKDGTGASLPQAFQGNEMLIIDSPIKVALHSSCKGAVIKNLKKRKFYLSPSEKWGLCFNPRAAAHKPLYSVMVETILDSCFVEELGCYFIHVADFGMRLPLFPGKKECPMNKFFHSVQNLRNLGVEVEILQFDVAYGVQLGTNELFQLSAKKERHNWDKYSILAGGNLMVYPMHQLPHTDDILHGSDLMGTVYVKKDLAKWAKVNIPDRQLQTSSIVSINGSNLDDDEDLGTDISQWERIFKLFYQSAEQANIPPPMQSQ